MPDNIASAVMLLVVLTGIGLIEIALYWLVRRWPGTHPADDPP